MKDCNLLNVSNIFINNELSLFTMLINVNQLVSSELKRWNTVHPIIEEEGLEKNGEQGQETS